MKKLLFFSISLVLLSSCVPHTKLVNFNEVPPEEFTLDEKAAIPNLPELHIQPDDRLSIVVSAFDEEAAEPFNQRNSALFGRNNANIINNQVNLNPATNPLLGYLVDQQGYIDFPVLGPIKVSGMTIEAATEMIAGMLGNYLEDSVVDMRYLNRKATIFGEVGSPGNIGMDRDRLTILDALERAGGLTSYSNRSNLLIVREVDNQREFGRINLQSKDIFTSPYFYLHHNDIVYVEPLKAKTASVQSPFLRYLTYATGVLSTATLVYTLIRR
ncbi:MAG: polysaccharide biosynthesis/export family protein [Phaeodactylibacter sp.]|nr:polysaccharide biosynthesis/export family protein [Phaeodactylibacter sp.]